MAIVRKYRTAAVLLHDTAMAALSFILSLALRLGDEMWTLAGPYLAESTIMFTVVAAAVFTATKSHINVWRYVSLNEIVILMRTAALIILIFLPALFFVTRLEAFPRSVLLINWFVLLALLAGPRVLYRLISDHWLDRAGRGHLPRTIPILLMGAGHGADLFIRALHRDPAPNYSIVGIIDDESNRSGQRLHGVPVLGGLDDLEDIVDRLARSGHRPQRLVVTRDRLTGAPARDLLNRAEALGLTLGRVPKFTAFESGVEETADIRSFAIEDLLGRPQTVLDRPAMRALIAGKRILVTGAGGTIGGELIRQIADFAPARLVLLDSSEFALYQADLELAEAASQIDRRAVLADVRDDVRLTKLFREERPDIVFHAAALKHVPLVEENPIEGVLTNVFGTRNVAMASRAAGAAAMVLISTDKAVEPTSVMGATKRLAELYAANHNEAADGTRIVTVRFGNVLGSTGSVVPLFRRQLAAGGPLTVTGPDVSRYFMTTREAVELVLEAVVLGLRAETQVPGAYVLDMGEPITIDELARQMIRLAGKRPDEDIQIAYTGLRPGEKTHEALFQPDEKVAPADYAGLMVADGTPPDPAQFANGLDSLELAAQSGDVSQTLVLLEKLVPNYAPRMADGGVVVALRERSG